MSIKTQKKLRFIPILNLLTIFAWGKLCFEKSITISWFMKNLLKIFAMLFVITAIRTAPSFIFKNETLDMVIAYVSIYLCFLSISWISVKAQEEILYKQNK